MRSSISRLSVLSILIVGIPLLSSGFAAAEPAAACSLWNGRSTTHTFSVKSYQAISEVCLPTADALGGASGSIGSSGLDQRPLLTTRRFSAMGTTTEVSGGGALTAQGYRLAVDPQTAEVHILNERCLVCHVAAADELNQMPFIQQVKKYTTAPFPLQNDGFQHSAQPLDGVILTVDLCPARAAGFESAFFQTLVDHAKTIGQPTPVALSLTATWGNQHPAPLAWLKEQNSAGYLDITWVNHSYSHPYTKGIPLKNNFLLKDKAQFPLQVLVLERFLIEHGELPSVFFRFPGLVSDEELIQKLKTYSLIPVGADAWLALGQKAQPGSIVLVHGNSNEPLGIHLFNILLTQTWPQIKFYSLYHGLH